MPFLHFRQFSQKLVSNLFSILAWTFPRMVLIRSGTDGSSTACPVYLPDAVYIINKTLIARACVVHDYQEIGAMANHEIENLTENPKQPVVESIRHIHWIQNSTNYYVYNLNITIISTVMGQILCIRSICMQAHGISVYHCLRDRIM